MDDQPNVILIIADQWSTRIADGSGQYDGVIQTPGIDRLAREGIRFTQSYSAFPLCGPARATIFTGLMPHHNMMLNNEEVYMERLGQVPTLDNLPTLGSELKRAGYITAYFGKEHAGGYGWNAIDQFGSMAYSAGGMLAEGSVFDQVFTRDAIAFIKQPHDAPFYMTLSLINPHDICKVLGGKVQGATIADAIFFCRTDDELYLRFKQRPDFPSNHHAPAIPGMQRDGEYMYEELHDWDENQWKRYLAAYYLLLEKTDWFVELLLDALRDAGLEENTIVIFTTDHGEMMGSHHLISKTIFYEESAKTMMLVKQPGKITPGAVDQSSLIGTQDVMPTILDLCGVGLPTGLDGRSFKARCYGQPDGDFSALYASNFDGRMLRQGPYKFVKSQIEGQDFQILFDLANDPDETRNVFGQAGYEQISADLHQQMMAWIEQEGIGLTFDDLSGKG
ncbi:MAG: sulfatase-like hydrolase/transferase [Chloroflexi bacterium]|nr:sulfatase-like hydrolase/transferase [Chloroflexota bacterium]